jgi:hypothetical protein
MKLLTSKEEKQIKANAEALASELQTTREEKAALEKKIIEIEQRKRVISPGATVDRDLPNQTLFGTFDVSLKVIPADYEFEVVPLIRKLVKVNPDLSQAFNDTVRLANTGHKIYFDQSVGAAEIDNMREFILNSAKTWHVGAAGINGIVNKMIRQGLVGGAIATDWVPNLALDNLEEVRFINPEQVRFVIDKNYKGYQPYQKIRNLPITGDIGKELRKLNANQFRYFALNGDTDLPYGTPLYMSALDAVATQRNMIDNIKFIIETLGVLGWVDARIEKPNQLPGESTEQYSSRLVNFLNQFKERVKKGTRDGISVGFKEDHEYDFKQTTKSAQGVTELFELNELLIASGIGYDAAFMGRPGASETLVTILFTKMLSQLTNLQDIIKENLEFGYKLALTLGGFRFKNLRVQFNRSTITDDLKFQQAEEIKIRNLVVKYHYGIIGLEQFADELSYIKPDQSTPRIDINNSDPMGQSIQSKKREDGKNDSQRKGNAKKKPQGKTKGAKGDKTRASADLRNELLGILTSKDSTEEQVNLITELIEL